MMTFLSTQGADFSIQKYALAYVRLEITFWNFCKFPSAITKRTWSVQ